MSLHFRDIVSQEEQLTAEISALEKQINYLKKAHISTRQDQFTLEAHRWFASQSLTDMTHQISHIDAVGKLVEENLESIPDILKFAETLLQAKKAALAKVASERQSYDRFFSKVRGETVREVSAIIQNDIVNPIEKVAQSINSMAQEINSNTQSTQDLSKKLWETEGLDTQDILTLIELKMRIDSITNESNRKLLEEYKNYPSIIKTISGNPRHKYVYQKIKEVEQKTLSLCQQIFELHIRLHSHQEISQEIIGLFEKVWNFIAILDKGYINSSNNDLQPVTHMFGLSHDRSFIEYKTITHLGRQVEQTTLRDDKEVKLMHFKPVGKKRLLITERSTNPNYINTNELVS